MKIIIVEGVDGSGKTTLVNELSQHAPDNTIITHCGPLKKHPLHEYLRPLEQLGSDDVFIADRWHVGEMVYGPLYRGVSRLTPEMMAYIEGFLASRAATRLAMTTPYAEVKRRLESRGEDFLQAQHLRLVCDFYEDYADRTDGWVGVQEYDAQRLLLDAPSAPLHAKSSYVGPLEAASVLFVGEERVHRRPNEIGHLNPFVPYVGSPGHQLISSIIKSGITSWGIMDVNDPDLFTVWKSLDFPDVIALGDIAARLAGEQGIPSLTVHHPAEAIIHRLPVTTYSEVIAHAARR
ncbi:MAG: hypothetical protein WBC29_02030 [Candidatus Moraniibacteriota bacterium]